LDDLTKTHAKRVIAEARASRDLKASHLRKTFGERMTVAMTEEVTQMEAEIAALDETIALIDAA
jgi:hypothetical protein